MIDKPTIHDLAKCKQEFTDDTLMPFGKHKDTPCGELPYGYIAWLYDQDWVADQWPKLFEYVLNKMEEYGESDDEGWS